MMPSMMEIDGINAPPLPVIRNVTRRIAVGGCGQCNNVGPAKYFTISQQVGHSTAGPFTHNALLQYRIGCIKVVVNQVRNLVGDFVCGPSHGMPRCFAGPLSLLLMCVRETLLAADAHKVSE